MAVSCAAFVETLLEAELFGHEKGAYTGADRARAGRFEQAHGGTLFLDEVGELSAGIQAKLLRVLEEREFMRVGGSETIRVDIRVVAATNADLEAAVENAQFRRDLYYRLKVVTLKIPPLRERGGDIPLLANHFLRFFAKENGREGMRFSPAAMDVLRGAAWEGNVREVRNLVESLVVLVPYDEIAVEHLPDEYRLTTGGSRGATETPQAGGGEPLLGTPGEDLTMEEIERRAIFKALERTGGNRTQAAEMLGIGLRTLQRKLKEYRLAGKD